MDFWLAVPKHEVITGTVAKKPMVPRCRRPMALDFFHVSSMYHD